MHDGELRGWLLLHCYSLRHANGGTVPVTSVIFGGTEAVIDSTIASIARQLADAGLISWQPSLGHEAGYIIGIARITAHGVDVVEGKRTASINIVLPGAGKVTVTAAAPQEAHGSPAEPPRNKLFTFKPAIYGLSIDLEEAFRRLSAWWGRRYALLSRTRKP